jgi:hypothetical protein
MGAFFWDTLYIVATVDSRPHGAMQCNAMQCTVIHCNEVQCRVQRNAGVSSALSL